MRISLLVCCFILFTPSLALAWKPTTHSYLADRAIDDALDDGMVSIPNLADGKVRSYPVDTATLDALRQARQQFRAGVLGPDAYPDLATGQQIIHPDPTDSKVPGGSNAWLAHVWKNFSSSPSEHAFRLGFLTHAAGDMFGHTFVNTFTGDAFTINPVDNAIKHVVIEGYIDKRLPEAQLGGAFFDASIGGLETLIYKTMIDARPGSTLDSTLLPKTSPGAKFSIPRIFSTIRANIDGEISAYYAKKRDLQMRIDNCAPLDFSCSAVLLSAELAAHVATNGLQTTYKEHWRDDIDDGLAAWPAVSHKVALALFYNPDRTAKTDEAEAALGAYVTDHLLSMAGAPDVVGLGVAAVGRIVDAITPDFLIEPIRKLKDDILNTLLVSAIGMDKAQLKGYLTRPDRYFDQVMSVGVGQKVTLAQFNSQYLKIADSGYTNPSESFDFNDLPAAYNTVILGKLILLSPDTVNSLIGDFGGSTEMNSENIMLGFIQTLDGSMQWRTGMSLAGDCLVYDKIFMALPDGGGCE